MKILTTLNFLTVHFENLLVIFKHMIYCIISCGPVSYLVSSIFSSGSLITVHGVLLCIAGVPCVQRVLYTQARFKRGVLREAPHSYTQ
jgi:hypothetical protein